MEERIRELYQGGKGIKSIAWELEIPVSTVRRRLLSMGIYLGTERVSHKEEEEPIIPPEQETMENPLPPLGRWIPRGDVAVRKDGDGWIISLGSGFLNELVSPPCKGSGSEGG